MKRLVIAACAFLLTLSTGMNAFAVEYTTDDSFYNNQPILFYSSTFSSVCKSNGGAGQETNDQGNQAEAYNYFVGKGLSAIAAAAILGNLKQESGFDPHALNPTGPHYGIAQWDTYRAKVLKQQEGDKFSTLEGQLDYIWWEFNNYGPGKEGLKILKAYGGTDAGQLALDFGSVYEGYNKQTEVGRRPENAREIFKQYGGGGASTGLSGSCTNTGAGDFVYFSQKDPKWANAAYGSGTVGRDGCGPTSLAMIVATFFDKSVTPDQMAKLGADNGSWIDGVGTAHGPLMNAAAKKYGFKPDDLTNATTEELMNYVKSGGLIYMPGDGPAPFTTSGHIVVMRGITDDGDIIIGDPYRGQSDTYSKSVIQAHKSRNTIYGIKKS